MMYRKLLTAILLTALAWSAFPCASRGQSFPDIDRSAADFILLPPSSLLDRPLPLTAAWGEIGLTGEVRAASHGERRMEEATRFEPELVLRPGANGVGTLQEALLAAGLAAVTRIRPHRASQL